MERGRASLNVGEEDGIRARVATSNYHRSPKSPTRADTEDIPRHRDVNICNGVYIEIQSMYPTLGWVLKHNVLYLKGKLSMVGRDVSCRRVMYTE